MVIVPTLIILTKQKRRLHKPPDNELELWIKCWLSTRFVNLCSLRFIWNSILQQKSWLVAQWGSIPVTITTKFQIRRPLMLTYTVCSNIVCFIVSMFILFQRWLKGGRRKGGWWKASSFLVKKMWYEEYTAKADMFSFKS